MVRPLNPGSGSREPIGAPEGGCRENLRRHFGPLSDELVIVKITLYQFAKIAQSSCKFKPSGPTLCPGCPVEENRLFLAIPTQPTIPVAGLGPAIHAFFPVEGTLGEDV